MDDEDLLKELETLRAEYAQITQPNTSAEQNILTETLSDALNEEELAMLRGNETTMKPSLPQEGRIDDSLDELLENLEKDEEPAALGLCPFVFVPLFYVAYFTADSMLSMKPLKYVKERFHLQKSPSSRMVDYLMSLPPDSEAPTFDEKEGPITVIFLSVRYLVF